MKSLISPISWPAESFTFPPTSVETLTRTGGTAGCWLAGPGAGVAAASGAAGGVVWAEVQAAAPERLTNVSVAIVLATTFTSSLSFDG